MIGPALAFIVLAGVYILWSLRPIKPPSPRVAEIREDLETPTRGLSRFRPTSLSEWVFVIFFGVCVITLGGMVVTALMGGGGSDVCAEWERSARLC